MQSVSLPLFCLGKNPGVITEFLLREDLEITVKIGLVGEYWTYKKEFSRLQRGQFGSSRAYCTKKFADRNTVQYGRLMMGQIIQEQQ